jgi:tripartite-type tricarboxylate transporter receptor subunit TctC
MRLRSAVVLEAGLIACLALFSEVQAQGYPTKPIRMIITCPPGCLPDILGRAMNQSLSQTFGKPIVVDNRSGANGNIAMENCAKSPPDGYTLCMPANVIMSLNPFAYDKIPFEPLELVPIVHLCNLDQAIAVHVSVPARNVRELVELSRAQPGKVTFASLGIGSTAHLYLEWLNIKSGAQFVHVPYKGSPQAMQALVAGEVMATALTPGIFSPLVASNKVRVIGVVSGEKRSPVMPDVPTLAEQGYALDFRNWFALYFPKDTPTEPVQRWNTEVNKLLADRAFTDKYFVPNSVTPTGGTPAELAAIARVSRQQGEELVKLAKLRLE